MDPISANQGAVLSVVNGDGTVSVWSVPSSATISISPAKGHGAVSQIDTSDSLAGAQAISGDRLAAFGAQ